MTDNPHVNPTLKLGPTPSGQVFYFFGARHANDPTDAQFGQLRHLWDEFTNTAKSARVIFTEGAVRDVPADCEDAIKQRGEVGAAQWLAKEINVTVICPEPDDTEQRKTLCGTFAPKDVAYTFIAQNLTGWFRHTRDYPLGEATERSLKREARFSEIYGFLPDADWLQNQHRELFGEQQLENGSFLDSITDPRKSDTLVNQIAAARTKMRDEYILGRIAEAWNSGKSIFIVYGKGHLAVLEPVLEKLV